MIGTWYQIISPTSTTLATAKSMKQTITAENGKISRGK